MIYNILRKDILLADIDMKDGSVRIYKSLPIGLNLINTNKYTDISKRVNNIINFKNWCAGRLLMMSQKHAKKICNALSLSQDMNDDNKMKIALVYKCTTLQDAYWVKLEKDKSEYKDVSLFQNKSNNILTPVSLRGESSIFNKVLKNWVDAGTDGTLAKSWVRENNKYYLLKDSDNSDGEVLASKVGIELGIDCVKYSKEDNSNIIKSECFTDEDYGFITFNTLVRQNPNAIDYIKDNFLEDYANLAVFTYLTGNEDLHDKNWGVKIDNNTGEIIGLAKNFDFDGCFMNSYSQSENNKFLPECTFIDNNNHTINYFYEWDIDSDMSIEGPTIKEAAIKYAPFSSINFDIDLELIPDKFKNTFIERLEAIQIIKDKDNIQIDL